ncbi:hypothetical protein ACFL02_08705 [Planctomycetota bacterium]
MLKKVRELGDRQVAPVGRENCKDCGRMGEVGMCILTDHRNKT